MNNATRYDRRQLIGVVPIFLVITFLAAFVITRTLTTEESYLTLTLTLTLSLALLGSVPPAVMMAWAIDDARHGFTCGHGRDQLLLGVVPWLTMVLLLVVALALDLVKVPQFTFSLSLVLLASLPALICGALQIRWNKRLPRRNPKSAIK
jgi:hypothetical protein